MKMLSIIIPTFRKARILGNVLRSLCFQEGVNQELEIIVVDDGSPDDTEEVVESAARASSNRIRYLKQANRGVSAARNLGIQAARGDLVLFLGDDIVCTPRLVAGHLLWHKRFSDSRTVVSGPVTWPPDLPIDDFMSWLDNSPYQFAYYKLKGKTEISFRYFYTCNVSLRTQSVLENPFDEDIRYGFEDTELGLRLRDQQYRLYFNESALGYHYHIRKFKAFRHRQKMVGVSLYYAHRNNPKMRISCKTPEISLTRHARAVLRGAFFPLLKALNQRRMIHKYWQVRLDLALLRGYRAAERVDRRSHHGILRREELRP